MQVNINQKQYDMPEGTTIYDAIRTAREALLEPPLGIVKNWIHNPECPILGIAEVDGRIVPLPALMRQLVRDGMCINTNTPKVREQLDERARLLIDRHECYFIREWQKMRVVEAENAGLITMEEWSRFSFPERGSAPSIIHDTNKCIRCRACVDICNDVQCVEALTFDEKLGVQVDENMCVRCGQCIHHCPMGATDKYSVILDLLHCHGCAFAEPLGAMREVDDTVKAWELLHDDSLTCVAQFAPAVRASLGEEFGIQNGELVTGRLYAALRRLGFKKVWDTNFTADLTIMEEGSEFIDRLNNGGRMPMFTSCCPAWIRFAETFFPDMLPHLSTAKSPQQMFGAVAKSYGAKSIQAVPETMRVISIMPCTAKKTEAARSEMIDASSYQHEMSEDNPSYQDVDLVLTTRELARLMKMANIDLNQMPEEPADSILGSYTGAAPIFGRTGGVMEAALRTVIAILSGSPPPSLEFDELGTRDGIKCAALKLGDKTLNVAVAHGLINARKVCESVRSGGEFSRYHFIEFMACPGGCIGGGGQPIPTNDVTRPARTLGLNYEDHEVCELRMSHQNPEVKAIYENFLEKPLGHLSHQLLHTHYTERSSEVPQGVH